MTRTVASVALSALLASAASTPADVVVWENVVNFPDDVCNAADGWSAVRIEDPDFFSYRCAADDFVLDRATRISAFTFYSVEIGNPVIVGGDLYIYEWDNGMPGKLLYSGVSLPMEHEVICENPNYGPTYRNTVHPKDLVLDAGGYIVGFRTDQGKVYDEDGKNTNGILSTRTALGNSRALWSFDIQPDGSGGGWVLLEVFNLSEDNEWCFRIEAEVGNACYPDCDGNTVLDLFDFLCFQNAFVNAQEYADCDGNGVYDLFDFLCFQNAFVGGC